MLDSPKSIVVTGGNGMLAWDLAKVFRDRFPHVPLVAPDRRALDITDETSIRSFLSEHRPTWVLNSAAYTSVDGAETERAVAEAVNAKGPFLLTQACKELGARLIHFSTDQVFDGSGTRAREEEDTPAPCNAYAETKREGEVAVLGEPSNLVLRVQWLYGERKDRFSPLRQKTVFSPFSDQFGAPAWTRKVAETVAALCENSISGLFHFSYDDYASWEEVFRFVCREWNLSVELNPKATHTMALPANRPLFSVLSNRKLVKALGVNGMGSWKEPLRQFLQKISPPTHSTLPELHA
jgi:dTDP-4-dehydrorhamnose reductase